MKSIVTTHLLTSVYFRQQLQDLSTKIKKTQPKLTQIVHSQLRTKVGFQFRHLPYLGIPDTIQTVLYRRVNFIGIALFVTTVIIEGLITPSHYEIISTQLN